MRAWPAAGADAPQLTVQARLTAGFQDDGLPPAILADHGSPWGAAGRGGLPTLEAWRLRRGIDRWHGRPLPPQTRGKIERLHRAIAAEVFADQRCPDRRVAPTAFDHWRPRSNRQRP